MSAEHEEVVKAFIERMSQQHTVEVTVTFMDGQEEVFVIGDDYFYTWAIHPTGLVFKWRHIVDRVHVPWWNVRTYTVKKFPTPTELRT